MTEIQPVTAPVASSVKPQEKEVQNNELVQAVEKNNETAKICAYTALGTSFATLIPLSVLAVKTGKISKVAQNIEAGVKPVLEGAKSITDNLGEASQAPKEIAEAVKAKLNELMGAVNSEKFEGLIGTLQEKVSKSDVEQLVGELKNSIKTITERVANKADEVNLESLNNVIKKFEEKLNEVNAGEITAEIKNILHSIMNKGGEAVEAVEGQFAEHVVNAEKAVAG